MAKEIPEISEQEQEQELEKEEFEGPGHKLKLARQAKKMTRLDVAKQLRLSKQMILDIENDDYQRAPSLIFVRGYLKSYAHLVEISGEDVLRAFDRLGIHENKKSNRTHFLDQERSIKWHNKVRWISYAILIALIILVILWWRNHIRHMEANKTTPITNETSSHIVPIQDS